MHCPQKLEPAPLKGLHPASRALCQAKRAPRAAVPGACLAAQTSKRGPGLGSFSRADRGIRGVRHVAPPTWLVSNILVGLRWVWRNGRGPHLEGRQAPQASSAFRKSRKTVSTAPHTQFQMPITRSRSPDYSQLPSDMATNQNFSQAPPWALFAWCTVVVLEVGGMAKVSSFVPCRCLCLPSR